MLAAEKRIATAEIIPEVAGTYPVVLYFGNDADREQLVALIKEAKPDMVARKLP
jgi:hypothetical protein